MESEGIPSLQKICYEVLAQYAGYIEEIDVMTSFEVKEICLRSNAFGLANLESLFTENLQVDVEDMWRVLYEQRKAQDPKKIPDLVSKIYGEGFYKQAVLAGVLKEMLASDEMDDEDLERLLTFSKNLKILEVNKITRTSWDWILSRFTNLIHLSMENSKLGPDSGLMIRDTINRCACLQTLNVNNVILKDQGALMIAQVLPNSKICELYMSFNDLTYTSIEVICNIIIQHSYLVIVYLNKNLNPREVKKGQILCNRVRNVRNIKLNIV
ncbi:hypothetical protein SteCoe_23273 [Stentor coeruleus]|uniref:Uncharacterized protein n=1 Tax=Stentor coeruleus TaxID=5963 RepID=A0A1R2BKB7_9CILI|nr:hypothetical protein SteCoe_23273 [Stentor coeruleus]